MTCQEIETTLADLGPGDPLPETAQSHLESCPRCPTLRAALAEVDRILPGMARLDAGDAVVERTLADIRERPALTSIETPRSLGPGVRAYAFPKTAYAVAAATLLLMCTGALWFRSRPAQELVAGDFGGSERRDHNGSESAAERPQSEEKDATPTEMAKSIVEPLPSEAYARAPRAALTPPAPPPPAAPPTPDYPLRAAGLVDQLASHGAHGGYAEVLADRETPEAVDEKLALQARGYLDDGRLAAEVGNKKQRAVAEKAKNDELLPGKGNAREEGAESKRESRDKITRTSDSDEGLVGERNLPVERDRSVLQVATDPNALDDATASLFLDERARTDGLVFQDAAGYWANTYLPGDPAMRLLEARLKQAPVTGPDGRALALPDAGVLYRQPFDAPNDAALAVYLQADRDAIDGPTRMLIQVGVKGTLRQSGIRQAMNIGVVLDAREPISPAVFESVRSLLTELARARMTGDRFSLTIAGRRGGTLIPPESFLFGPLSGALSDLSRDQTDQDLPTWDLPAAVEAAMAAVSRADDPTAPLGASVVLLVTPSRLGPHLPGLIQRAHAGAVNGIPLSVIAVGTAVDLPEIDRLTLSGQGHRRLLTSPTAAREIVGRELHAASRVVARAVRLRIRLAPRVRLVEVLGSYRLDEPTAERVREAEKSVDLRLAKSLGIQADRGDDEEGIQIVIPAYHAADEHFILLDVVADRAGSLADVTVRYKDLVHLRNGVARANLTISRRKGESGPLARTVLKNAVAFRLSQTLEQASALLAGQQIDAAKTTLEGGLALVDGLRCRIPGWASDDELAADSHLLRHYLALIGSGSSEGPLRNHVSDALLYTSFRKVTASLPDTNEPQDSAARTPR